MASDTMRHGKIRAKKKRQFQIVRKTTAKSLIFYFSLFRKVEHHAKYTGYHVVKFQKNPIGNL